MLRFSFKDGSNPAQLESTNIPELSLSQIIRCNFPVSENTCHSAILIQKMTTIFFPLKFPNSAAFLFSWESLAETPFCFFLLNQCCFSSVSRRALRVLAAEWAESVAAMGGGCLSERQYVLVASHCGKPITV